MKGCNYIFYTPEYQYEGMPHGEMCGDLMPYYHDGTFTFVYLYKYCIYAVDTKDFVHYENFRIILQNGTPDEQDWHAATGSVCRKDDTYYFYYTGFCEGNRSKEGKYEQAILRASSRDFVTWEKDKDYFFPPDQEHFAGRHWRDPHVFFNNDLEKYCMLVTACEKDGAEQRSGCTAVYVSDDILHWTYYKTICSPRIFPTHECQDSFKIGNQWYLTFSTYEKMWQTRYKTANHFDGPWRVPAFDDCLEGRDFYAAKTVSDGSKRYLVGWQSIRKDCSNQGRYVWGGNVVVHQLVQRADGTLGTVIPDQIRSEFINRLPISLNGREGSWTKEKSIIRGLSKDGFGWAELGKMTNVSLIHAVLEWSEDTQVIGIMFHTNGSELIPWCQLRLELNHNRIVLERFGKTELDQYFDEERPIQFRKDHTAEVFILTSNDTIVAYVDDTALSGRCYGVKPGSAGLFVEYGSIIAETFELYTGNEDNRME